MTRESASRTRVAVASPSAAAALAAPDAHAAWFGQPAQLEAVPAVVERGPTHSSFAFSGWADIVELERFDFAQQTLGRTVTDSPDSLRTPE